MVLRLRALGKAEGVWRGGGREMRDAFRRGMTFDVEDLRSRGMKRDRT